MGIKKTRKDVNKDYNAKRLQRPKINVITDVPEKSVKQLEALALIDGSKKKAVLRAIQERYEKVYLAENQKSETSDDYPLFIDELFDN